MKQARLTLDDYIYIFTTEKVRTSDSCKFAASGPGDGGRQGWDAAAYRGGHQEI